MTGDLRTSIDLVLDPNSPFLALAAPAGRALGLGLVHDIECVLVADDPAAGITAPLPDVATRNHLPLVHLTSAGEVVVVVPGIEAVRVGNPGAAPIRQIVRHLGGPTAPGPPPPATEPRSDAAMLTGEPEPRALIAAVADDSRFDELPGGECLAGWATVCGMPVGVVAGNDHRFAVRCSAKGLPLLGLHGPAVIVGRNGEARFAFAWAGSTPGYEVDAFVEPRDARVALGIALACSRPR